MFFSHPGDVSGKTEGFLEHEGLGWSLYCLVACNIWWLDSVWCAGSLGVGGYIWGGDTTSALQGGMDGQKKRVTPARWGGIEVLGCFPRSGSG